MTLTEVTMMSQSQWLIILTGFGQSNALGHSIGKVISAVRHVMTMTICVNSPCQCQIDCVITILSGTWMEIKFDEKCHVISTEEVVDGEGRAITHFNPI